MERVYDLEKLKCFSSESQKILLYETDKSYAAMWCLEPGQEIFLHNHPNADDVWIVLEGEGLYFMGDNEETTIRKGMAVLATAGQVHGMRNTGSERFSFIAVSSPFPVETIRL